MEKLSSRERVRLIQAFAEGDIKHASHRKGAEIDGAGDDFRTLDRLCVGGYLRLYRIVGNRYDPRGERIFVFRLTDKGKREARRS